MAQVRSFEAARYREFFFSKRWSENSLPTVIPNRRGTPALATAGTGDVLTGVVATLLAQGLTAFDAARAAAYLHALAGEISADEMGAAGILAGDVRDRLPIARRLLYERDDLDEL